MDEENKNESAKENWVPIFDVKNFEDVVEFEKFMSGELWNRIFFAKSS